MMTAAVAAAAEAVTGRRGGWKDKKKKQEKKGKRFLVVRVDGRATVEPGRRSPRGIKRRRWRALV